VGLDLEGELLRAAQRLRGTSGSDVFTIETLRELIVSAPREFSRLAHPLLAQLIDSLTDSLIACGLLVRVEGGCALTDDAHAYLDRSPQYLDGPGLLRDRNSDEVLPSSQA
jgi:hypothetical protein